MISADFTLSAAPGPAWSVQDTEDYLRDQPLPNDFEWKGQLVMPARGSKRGYGAWLRETPYHQGLFELIHRLLLPVDVLPKRTDSAKTDELCAWIRAAEGQRSAQQTLF